MHIVHLPHLYPPSRGGVQELVKSLSEGLVAAGHEVSVMTSNIVEDDRLTRPGGRDRYEGTVADREIINGVDVRRFAVSRMLQNVLYHWPNRLGSPVRCPQRDYFSPYEFFQKQPFCPWILPALYRLKPDLVTAYGISSPFPYYCYLLNRLTGQPYVVFAAVHVEAGWIDEPVAKKYWVGRDESLR